MVFDDRTKSAIVALPPLNDIMNINNTDKDNNEVLNNVILNSGFYKDFFKLMSNLPSNKGDSKYKFNILIYNESSGVVFNDVIFRFDVNNLNI